MHSEVSASHFRVRALYRVSKKCLLQGPKELTDTAGTVFKNAPELKSWVHTELILLRLRGKGPISFLTPSDLSVLAGGKTPQEERAAGSKNVLGEGQKGLQPRHPPWAGPNVLGDVKFSRADPEWDWIDFNPQKSKEQT